MKFDQLAANTPQVVKSRAGKVRVQHAGVSKIEELDGTADIFSTGSDGQKYLTWVLVEETGNTIVSCSCPFFLYNCEAALAAAGSGVILYSNGAPPVHTNPMKRPYLCKHLFKVWQGRNLYKIGYHPPEEETPEEEPEEEVLEAESEPEPEPEPEI
jgi:hypothetical protein